MGRQSNLNLSRLASGCLHKPDCERPQFVQPVWQVELSLVSSNARATALLSAQIILAINLIIWSRLLFIVFIYLFIFNFVMYFVEFYFFKTNHDLDF